MYGRNLATLLFLLLVSGVAGHLLAQSGQSSIDPSLMNSIGYTVGVVATLEYNSVNYTLLNVSEGLGAGPPVAGVSVVNNLAVALVANDYNVSSMGEANASIVVQPPPETRTITQTQTVTDTVTQTTTKTVSKTTTITTGVPQAPTTIQVGEGPGAPLWALAAPAAVLVILLFLGMRR